ncbi:hypothetical protein IHQ71_14515 [Rhizobium sp. TH2]|uniref:calcium-binding protein n=1 Tax=Rhizobium sp. TH2 TaxID=2775403 RepID=UPI00215818CB|nr:calcium-binding protein [Rhizobium sp. TH2]UVC11694.1 hypothetical protein IHQ71_14515 [Rhizobium sp. TH2]
MASRRKLYGSEGDDTLAGSSGVDWIWGLEGHDIVRGYGGNDSIAGGAGNDVLYGGRGDDYLHDTEGDSELYGEEGNDILSAVYGIFTLVGGAGNDRLYASVATGLFDGGGGRDLISLGTLAGGVASITGGTGDDTIVLQNANGNSNLSIDAGEGFDTLGFTVWDPSTVDVDWSRVLNVESIECEVDYAKFIISDTIFEHNEHWRISGTQLDASAVTKGTVELIGSFRSADTLVGGSLDDVLFGDWKNDILKGGDGDDRIDGGRGEDIALFDGDFADYSIAYDFKKGIVTVTDVGPGETDTISNVELLRFDDLDYHVEVLGFTRTGGAGNDKLAGGNGNDILIGRGGNDQLAGKRGADWLDGGAGNDTLRVSTVGSGDEGHDTLLGGEGNDEIWVNGGYGFIDGGAGLNRINVFGGVHTILGGVDGDAIWVSDALGGTVLSGAGDDFVMAYGTSLFVDGGKGNDVLQGWPSSHKMDVDFDGGEGFDTFVVFEARLVDWSRLINIERLEVEFIDTAIFELTDAMFARQSSWIIDFSDSKDGFTPDDPPVLIDGSGVTAGQLTLIGRDLTGDTLIGGALDDSLSGLNGNDILDGGKGDDFIDGGKGVDGAVFSGALANYAISYDEESKTYQVTDNVGDDGTDTIKDIEKLRFTDQVYWF